MTLGRLVFRFRNQLCSSCSGRGTGLVCSSCGRGVAEERDRLANLLRKRNDEMAVGWFIVIDGEGVVGAFETKADAEAAGFCPDCPAERDIDDFLDLPGPNATE